MNQLLFKIVFIAIVTLAFSHAYAERCELDIVSSNRLRFADNDRVTQFANRFFASDNLRSELQLFLKFSLPQESFFGTTTWYCSEPKEEDIQRFLDISTRLEKSPIELRADVKLLVEKYPEQLKGSYIRYRLIADILDSQTISDEQDLSSYLDDVEAFKDEFLRIMKPNFIRVSGTLISEVTGPGINSLDNEDAVENAQAEIKQRIEDSSSSRLSLMANAISPPSFKLNDTESITLINDKKIYDYAALYSLGLTPKDAVDAVTDVLRETGSGYLNTAIRTIRDNQR